MALVFPVGPWGTVSPLFDKKRSRRRFPLAGRVQVVSGSRPAACAPPAAAAVRACAGWVQAVPWVLVSAPALKAAP